MALDAYSRQQVIEQLRQTLHDGARAKGSGALIKSLSSRLQTLNSSDTNGGEFWSIFERNFDLIHEHFFRNLRQPFFNEHKDWRLLIAPLSRAFY